MGGSITEKEFSRFTKISLVFAIFITRIILTPISNNVK